MSLRVVGAGEVPPRKEFASVTAAAAEGTRRDLLVTMRARVAVAVQDPETPARDLAALTRRLMEIAKDIEALDAKERETEGVAATADEHWEAI